MKEFWKSAAFTVLGAVLTAAVTLYTTSFIQKSENSRHIKELAYKMAVEEWKSDIEKYKKYSEKHNKDFGVFTSDFSAYLIKHLMIASYANSFNMELSEEGRKKILSLVDMEFRKQDEKIEIVFPEIKALTDDASDKTTATDIPQKKPLK